MDNQSSQPTTMTPSANDTHEYITDVHVPIQLRISLSVIVMLCSIIANFLVIAIVFSNAHMRTSFNYLIVNMSVSDLFVPFITIPLQLTNELAGGRWFVDGRFGEALCKVCYFLGELTPAVSVFSLVIIAVNRFVAIVFPMHVNAFNKKTTARLLIIVPWIVSSAFCSHALYTLRLFQYNGYPSCQVSWEPAFDTIAAFRIYVILVVVFFLVIPFLSISVLYSLIIYKIYQSSENVSSMIQDNRSRKHRDRQIFYLSIVIIMAFAVLWSPILIYHAVRLHTWKGNPTTDFALYIMAWSNSVINPLICILFNGNFRKGFRRLCCRFYWKKKRETIQSRPTRTTKQSKDIDSSSRSNSVDRYQILTAV